MYDVVNMYVCIRNKNDLIMYIFHVSVSIFMKDIKVPGKEGKVVKREFLSIQNPIK